MDETKNVLFGQPAQFLMYWRCWKLVVHDTWWMHETFFHYNIRCAEKLTWPAECRRSLLAYCNEVLAIKIKWPLYQFQPIWAMQRRATARWRRVSRASPRWGHGRPFWLCLPFTSSACSGSSSVRFSFNLFFTIFDILSHFWYSTRLLDGKTICLPTPDSVYPYSRRLKELKIGMFLVDLCKIVRNNGLKLN